MKKFITFVLSTVSALGFMKILSIVPFTRMCADDFTFTKRATIVGIWKTQIDWYLELTGRFVRNAMLIFFGLISSMNGTVIIYNLFTFLMLFVSLFFLFRNMVRNKVGYLSIVLLASLSFITFYLITPYKDESWYWMSGSVTYLWPTIFCIGAVSVLISKSKSLTSVFLAFLLGFLTGPNEFMGPIFGAVLATLIIKSLYKNGWKIPKNNPYFHNLCAVTAGVGISFLIMFLAPGNYVRMRGPDSSEMSLFATIVYSIQTGPKMILSTFSNNAMYLIAFFATLAFYFSVIRPKGGEVAQSISNIFSNVFYMLCAPFFLSFLYLLPGYRSLSRIPPGRADVILVFVILMSLIFSAYELSKIFIKLDLNKYTAFKVFGYVFAFALFIGGFHFTNTFAWDVYIAKNYSDSFDKLFSQLTSVKGVKDKIIMVEPLPESGLVHSEKLNTDYTNWANGPYSGFFELKGIAIEKQATTSAGIKK